MKTIYFISPSNPSTEELLEIEDFLQSKGYSIGFQPESAFLKENVKKFILTHGITKCLSFQPLHEEVLPDSMDKNILAETIRYKLKMLNPVGELLIIDPYLFHGNFSQDYLPFVRAILMDTILIISHLNIVTLPNPNAYNKRIFYQLIESINPNISINTKGSNVFHDRFWITDKVRGLFIGTSLNGIGNRYSLVDYLSEPDSREIYDRFQSLPQI